MLDILNILFLFLLGSCIGSFLNVVVWRLPRTEWADDRGPIYNWFNSFRALSDPPSHCPQCLNRLKWYDNIPILGWIKLGGKCRFCKKPFSIRYPTVELITALMFVGYYVAYYMLQTRTCCPQAHVLRMDYDIFGNGHEVTNPQWVWSESWPIYFLYMALLSGLFAASMIDFESYCIPIEIPWVLAIIGFIVHPIVDRPHIPGALNLVGSTGPPLAALATGSAIGLSLTIVLWMRGVMPTSFPAGEPMLDVDREEYQRQMTAAKCAGQPWDDGPLPPEYTTRQIRAEISREMLFLLPSLILGSAFLAATIWIPWLHGRWEHLIETTTWLNALLGSLLGAMVGGFVVWIIRIVGTIVFRKVAMGLGDVHLMFGVGAIIGGSGATFAFFIAPFCAILTAIYRLIFRKSHQMPLGPYLSMATALVMLFYCPIVAYLQPGLEGLPIALGDVMHKLGDMLHAG